MSIILCSIIGNEPQAKRGIPARSGYVELYAGCKRAKQYPGNYGLDQLYLAKGLKILIL